MFDRKDDDIILVGYRWFKVDDHETLRDVLVWIRSRHGGNYYPTLWRILGQEGHLYGYMFTARFPVLMKKVDEKTVYVYDTAAPHELIFGGNGSP